MNDPFRLALMVTRSYSYLIEVTRFRQKITDFLPANIFFFKFDSRNTRKRCKISSTLTIKTPERPH